MSNDSDDKVVTTTSVTLTEGQLVTDTSVKLDNSYYDYYEDYTTANNIFSHIGIKKAVGNGKCSSCENISDLAISYSGPGITRYICRNCCTSKIDQFFGVKINSDIERMLYGKK